MIPSPYRPRTKGHDYYDRGVYLITLVVRERQRLLGELNMNLRAPGVNLTVLGDIVGEEWDKTAAIQAGKGRNVRSLGQVVMPDHWHGIIWVEERMDKSVGDIVQAFKSACTSRWRRLLPEASPSSDSPIEFRGRVWPNEAAMMRGLSKVARKEYYASKPGFATRPLFDDNYDDTICMSRGQLDNMVAYVKDNPRRAIMRKAFPDFMRRCLHVLIGGHEYAAFGNLFLLQWVDKQQVMCHRRHPITKEPYETTADFRQQYETWLSQARSGYTVLVTPGISKGEQVVRNACISDRLPLILLQKEPITDFWKPGPTLFEACADGSLLILSPYGQEAHASDYELFHNLNALATEICAFYGEAKILRTMNS